MHRFSLGVSLMTWVSLKKLLLIFSSSANVTYPSNFLMTSRTRQQQSTARVLQNLSARLQQLTSSVEFTSNRSFNPLVCANTSNLITQLETALVSLQVEQLHQQAIAQGVWDFFPTPQPVRSENALACSNQARNENARTIRRFRAYLPVGSKARSRTRLLRDFCAVTSGATSTRLQRHWR